MKLISLVVEPSLEPVVKAMNNLIHQAYAEGRKAGMVDGMIEELKNALKEGDKHDDVSS